MCSQPLVSICIPRYNSEEFLAATLEDVLLQRFTEFEVIIAGDKSIDCTVSIMKQFADPRIVPIEDEEKLGLGANWNKALSRARGECVKLLGDDDVLYPERPSRKVVALEDPANAGARGFFT